MSSLPAHLIYINPVLIGHDVIIKEHRCFSFNSKSKAIHGESGDLLTSAHKGLIRVGKFDTSGSLFVSGGDDKSVKVWDVKTWKCLGTRTIGKKVSGVAFSGGNVIWSDRSGTIFQVALEKLDNSGQDVKDLTDVSVLLGHCSWVTALEMADNNVILTGERDEKIRISHYPDTYDIISYCLGHKSFVSALTVIPSSNLLVSGSEGNIILWNFMEGTKIQDIELENSLVRCIAYLPALSSIAVIVENNTTVPVYKLNTSPVPGLVQHSTSITLPSVPLFAGVENGENGDNVWILTVDNTTRRFAYCGATQAWKEDFSIQSPQFEVENKQEHSDNEGDEESEAYGSLSYRHYGKARIEKKPRKEGAQQPRKKRRKRLGGKPTNAGK